ncbi:MAG: ABC transporter permease [Fimbriimonadaceae bacterium]|nr:ABC transporter permease [Fimbriimonadaceae bacterium]
MNPFMVEPAQLLLFATPVALAALGETATQRAGVLNIGLEGVMLTSAYAAVVTAHSTGSIWLGLGVGVLAGLLLTLISAFFCVKLAVDQVVTGTAITLLALGLTGTLYRAQFGQSGKLLSLSDGFPKFEGFDPIMAFAVLSVAIVWFALFKTRWGLAVRAAGEFPKAAEAAGFRVPRLRLQAMMFGGLFGALAGAYLGVGVAGSFAEGMTNGKGFVAIAMVTFGRWKPLPVFLASILIGYLESLQSALQGQGFAIPTQALTALPYIAALLVLVLVGKGTAAPAALALPYKREG